MTQKLGDGGGFMTWERGLTKENYCEKDKVPDPERRARELECVMGGRGRRELAAPVQWYSMNNS
jgi:hypothetical protein